MQPSQPDVPLAYTYRQNTHPGILFICQVMQAGPSVGPSIVTVRLSLQFARGLFR